MIFVAVLLFFRLINGRVGDEKVPQIEQYDNGLNFILAAIQKSETVLPETKSHLPIGGMTH